MKIKTSETTRMQLDWLVAKAFGFVPAVWEKRPWGRELVPAENPTAFTQNMLGPMGNNRSRRLINPTTDWAQGGPIIEREWISIYQVGNNIWKADIAGRFNSGLCPTPLIAAMRCFVASKLGEEVEIPQEILE